MKSSVVVAKHPLHPMLIPIPIGSFLLALVGDLAYLGTNNTFWYSFSTWAMGIGIIGALLAALPGFVDYFTVVPRAVKRLATMHMVLNLTIVALFALNVALRVYTTASTGTNWWLSLALTVIGNAALMVSGWLGGELVYRKRVAVEEAGQAEYERFRITLSPEEAERVQHRR